MVHSSWTQEQYGPPSYNHLKVQSTNKLFNPVFIYFDLAKLFRPFGEWTSYKQKAHRDDEHFSLLIRWTVRSNKEVSRGCNFQGVYQTIIINARLESVVRFSHYVNYMNKTLNLYIHNVDIYLDNNVAIGKRSISLLENPFFWKLQYSSSETFPIDYYWYHSMTRSIGTFQKHSYFALNKFPKRLP